MRTIWWWSSRVVLLLVFAFPAISQEINPEFFTVEVSARANASPPALNLQWLADTNATNYAISRKMLTASNWTLITNLPGSAVQFADGDVEIGSAYEYQIIKGSPSKYVGSGYLYGGIEVPPIEQRGSVILLIDSTWKAQLAS